MLESDMGLLEVLKTLGDGRVIDDLHEQLNECLMAVRMAHKKGKVVLTLVVTPSKDAEMSKVTVWGDVTSKIPHIERGADIFYVTGENGLSRRNPRQPALPPNTVKMPPRAGHEDELDGQSRAAGERV